MVLSHFVWDQPGSRVADLDDPAPGAPAIHAGHTSRSRPGGTCRRPVDLAVVERLIAEAEHTGIAPRTGSRGRALVAIASGIGDIIRATPLVRVLHRLGYAVDVLCAPDCPGSLELLDGAPEIARLIPLAAPPTHESQLGDARTVEYDVACFMYQACPLETQVRARRRLRVQGRPWLREGDSRSIERIAGELGWEGAMPPPFVACAPRDFELPPGTIALHAGGKSAWKKWHGFAELAERLENVVLVGTAEDAQVEGMYFASPCAWPAHASNYIGQLSLAETASLIHQCAALVCNDSGMQHVGVAVGTPTFPLFGITSPEREIIPSPHVHPLTKGLPCELDCRSQPWGRRDCERHLECLRTLTVAEVLQHVQRAGVTPALRTVSGRAVAARVAAPAETITVAVRLEGGLGDVLLASALLEALHDELRRCTIDVYHQDPKVARFVFGNAAFVRAIHPLSRLAADERGAELTVSTGQFVRYHVRDRGKLERVCPDFAAKIREASARLEGVRGLADRQPALDGLWGRLSSAAGRNVLGNLGFLGGVGVSRTTRLFLAPDPAAYRPVEERLGGGEASYVTLHDGFGDNPGIAPGYATKCWPLEHWETLVRALRATWPGLEVVQVGARDSRHIPGVDVDLADRTSLDETAWILKNARLHIDTDSGLVHVARALHTPAVALFGPTDAAFHGHAENSNVVAANCSGCWWSTPDWLARCPRGLARPECMASIGPDRVLVAVAHHLGEQRLPGATAGNVVCYDGALCRAEAARLADMCAALGLPLRSMREHSYDSRTGVHIHASRQWEYLYALSSLQAAFGRAQGLHIADLGGGRGALAPYLAHLGHEVECFDLDYRGDDGDPTVALRFRDWARGRGLRLRFGSLHNVPAPSASFDAVTCISALEHVPYEHYALREALRIVRPGGVLVLTFAFANQPGRSKDATRHESFSPERLVATLGRVGLACTPPDADEVQESAGRMAADGVPGIPAGRTVAGVVLRRS